MKRIAKVLYFSFAMLISFNLSANHILGGNISVECLGGGQYGVTLTIYKDCFGATAAPATETIFLIPSGCVGALPQSVSATLQSEVEISDLCPTEAINSSCLGGIIPGAQALVYYSEVTLDPLCSYNISYSSGDWNNFQNLDVSGLPNAYLQSELDLTQGCNSTISVNGSVPYSCIGDPVTYSLDVINPDGLDLSYSLVCPQTTGGFDAPLFNPCDEPIPGITIDPATGQIDFTSPNIAGNYVVSIAIEMSSGGNVIGTYYENMAFTVRFCDIEPSTFDLPEIQSVGNESILIDATNASACVGDSLIVYVQASNSNPARTITLSSDFEALFPGGLFSQDNQNPAIAEMRVLADESMIGTTLVTIDSEDDACPAPTLDQIQVNLTVTPSLVVNVLDTLVCSGQSIDLEAEGDSDFLWTLVSGDATGLSANGSSQTVTPLTECEIEVQALNADVNCNFRDTIVIAVSLQSFDAAIVNETCIGNDGSIDFEVVGGSGNFSYDWIELGEPTQDVSGLVGGDYTVTVVDLDLIGCTRDTIIALNSAPPPNGSISGDITICEGESADILFTLSGTGPFAVELFNEESASLEAVPAVNDQDVFSVSPAVTTTYDLQNVLDSNNPQCDINLNSEVTVTVRPIVNASFIDPGSICAGDDVDVEVDIDQAGTYVLEYTPNDGTPASPANFTDGDFVELSPLITTNYEITSVAYSDAPSCANTIPAGLNLLVDPLPTVDLTDDQTICAGDAVTLHLSLTGVGPWSVEHDFAGQASPLVVGVNEFDWLIGQINASIDVTVFSVTDDGTGCQMLNVDDMVQIIVNDLPVANLLNDQIICAGSDASFEFELTGDGPFNVTWNDGVDHVELGVTDGYTFNEAYNADTQVCITQIEDSNMPVCSSTIVSCVDVTVNQIPNADITGQDQICEGECYDLTINNFTGTGPFEIDYELTAQDDGASIGGVVTAGGLNNGDMINVCPAESADLTLLAVRDSNTPTCETTATSVFDLQVNQFSQVDMFMDTLICEGTCADISYQFIGAEGPVNIEVDGVMIGPLDLVADMVDSVYIQNVCPLADQIFTLDSYEDLGNPCSSIINNEVEVTLTPEPSADYVMDEVICAGDNVDLEFELPTGGPFDIELSIDDGLAVTIESLIGVQDADAYNVSPAVSTSYTITSVTDMSTDAECSALPNLVTTVTVNTAPLSTVTDTICANTADSYELVFTIDDGDAASYSVAEPGTLVENAGIWTFTSDPADPTIQNTWNIDDANSCDPSQIVINPFQCPVLTFAGTMDPTALNICSDGVVNAIFNNDEILDGNDALSFIIHSNPGANLGIIYYVSGSPNWDLAADLDFVGTLDYGTTYYISSVAGDDDGAGNVDFSSPNVSVSAGTPVVFYEIPDAVLSGGFDICIGESSEINFDATGTGPFQYLYQIDGAPAAGFSFNTPLNNAILPTTIDGDYTLLSVTNGFCPGTVAGAASVVVNPLPTGTIGSDGSFCEGESFDLQLELTGTPNWTVTITHDDGDGNLVDEDLVVTASPAVYNVTDSLEYFITNIVDGNNCANDADSAPVTVTIDPLPTALYQFGDSAICAGSSVDVLIDLTGTAPWSLDYANNAGVQNAVVASSPFVITVNTNDVITLTNVGDAIACANPINEIITITEVAIPLVDAGPDLVLCSNEVGVLGTPENPAYTYQWTPVTDLETPASAQSNVSILNNTPVDQVLLYTLTAEEGFCSASADVQVTVHPIPQANAGDDEYICFGDDFQLNASGGVSFLWEASPWITPGDEVLASPLVTPLANAEFVVTVTDAVTCTANDTIQIFVPEEFTVLEDFTTEVCFGICDGEISLEPNGSWGTIQADWAQVADNSFDLIDLCAGIYDYTLTDSIGCELIGSIEIIERVEYFFDDVLITQPICFGDETGIINAQSATGVDFTLIDPATDNPTGTFIGLPAGSYDLEVVDGFGCLADTSVTFTEVSSEMNISVPNPNFVICVDQEVPFTANANGGEGVLSYFWYNGTVPGGFESNDNPYNVIITDSATYFVHALDEQGCSTDTLSVSAQFDTPIDVLAGPEPSVEICQGECVDLTADAQGGNGILDVEWFEINGGLSTSLGALTDVQVCPLTSAVYVVYANDGCSQTATDTVFVPVFETPEVMIESDIYSGCFPLTVELFNLTDPLLSDQCSWDLGDGNLQPICGDITYTFADAGTYSPELTVTSPLGCTSTGVIDVPIEVYGYPIADFEWTPDPVTLIENEVQLLNLSVNGSNFNWDIGLGETSIEENPVFVLPALDFAFTEVCLEAISPFGCADTICKTIFLESELSIFVPNAFTPDNDGVNEVFKPIMSGFDPEQYIFRIWDRWGVLVFETTDYNAFWTGDFENGNYYAQNEVYIWDVEVIEIATGDKKNFKGFVTLLR